MGRKRVGEGSSSRFTASSGASVLRESSIVPDTERNNKRSVAIISLILRQYSVSKVGFALDFTSGAVNSCRHTGLLSSMILVPVIFGLQYQHLNWLTVQSSIR